MLNGKLRLIKTVCLAVIVYLLTQGVGEATGQLPSFSDYSANVDLHSGAASLSIPIEVPPGRGGIQPNIQLQYSSLAGNEVAGVGWQLELGSIQRSTQHQQLNYTDQDTFILAQTGSVQELIFDSSAQFYRSKTEGGCSENSRKVKRLIYISFVCYNYVHTFMHGQRLFLRIDSPLP